MTHGVFTVTLSAEDNEGNSHSIMVKVRIDMHIVWTDQNTASSSMSIDATPDCEDGDPLPDRITIVSSAQNNPDSFLGGGGNAEVTWTLTNPSDEEIGSNSGSIGNNQEESWDYTTRDIVTGVWTLTVDVTNDDTVDVSNDVTIAYAEGAEDSTNPRPE